MADSNTSTPRRPLKEGYNPPPSGQRPKPPPPPPPPQSPQRSQAPRRP